MVALGLDHIVISARTLPEGVAYVEDTLGVTMGPGGKHPLMGTHNRLLGLGPAYLEVIAIDPDAPPPDRPRWYNLDRFDGAPRITNWVAVTNDMSGALDIAPAQVGPAIDVTRDLLRWRLTVPEDGGLPFDGGFPTLIDWGDTVPPPKRLPDSGCRVARLDITCPEADRVEAALARFSARPDATFREGPFSALAELSTPKGPVSLR